MFTGVKLAVSSASNAVSRSVFKAAEYTSASENDFHVRVHF